LVNPSGRPRGGDLDTYSRVGTFEAWFKSETDMRDIFRVPAEAGESGERRGASTFLSEGEVECIHLI